MTALHDAELRGRRRRPRRRTLPPRPLVRRPGHPRARAGADLPAQLAVRGPRRPGRRARRVHHRRRPGPSRSRSCAARDGVLRALVNVCRHRGHHVLEGTGSCTSLQCPYHAWTYDLDGALRKIPRGEGLPVGELGLLRGLGRGARPVRLRPPGARRAALRGGRRRPARRARLLRRRPRAHGLPPPRPVDARSQLEDRRRELPRVLPLPRRAPGAREGDRRRAGLLPARDAPDVLGAEGHAARPGRAAVDARRRDRPRAVALPVAQHDASTSSPGRRTSPSTSGSRTGRAGPWASRSTSSRRTCRRRRPTS